MVEKSIYLFLGEDSVSKERKIALLKKENLKDNSQAFDTFGGVLLWQSQDTSPKTLKQRRSETPSFKDRTTDAALSINPEPFDRLKGNGEFIEPEQTSGFSPRCVEWVDYELLYADSLEPERLKELLNSLPVFSPKKIIVIKEADKLSPHHKRLLLIFAKSSHQSSILLILDTAKPEVKDAFFQEISEFSRVFNFASTPALNVFDLGRMIAQKKSKDALLCLSRLLAKGEKQSNILGVIGWQWKKLRPRMAASDFRKGLELLQEADLRIKRSRLKGDLALELLVVKLCALNAATIEY